jgi:SAM-dependent methyltransferase
VVDALFEEARLAAIYDAIDDDRSDLNVYAALADALGAHVVLDVGCGTGTFACMLAAEGKKVIGIDPAAASLDVARRKPAAGRVRWLEGEATGLPPVRADLVTMTGNVAQVFLTDTNGCRCSWRPEVRYARKDTSSSRCVTRRAAHGSVGPRQRRHAGSSSPTSGESRRGWS